MKISTVAEMRGMDTRAIEEFRMPEEVLMENAGAAAFGVLSRMLTEGHRRVVIVSGTGNNGGDGLVVARRIASAGGTPLLWIAGDPSSYRPVAARNYEICRRMGLPVHRADTDVAGLQQALGGCDAVVDGLFGTGLSRAVEGVYGELIRVMNRCPAPVLSLDIPSGVDGDTGSVHGEAVRAAATVSFGLPKLGNLLYPGFELCGELWVSHISFPPALYESADVLVGTNDGLRPPERSRTGHKGSFGRALIVAGSGSYYGAPYLASSAFLLSGGGYARLAAPSSMVPALAGMAPEVVYLPQEQTAGRSISSSNGASLVTSGSESDVVVVGPGLGLEADAMELVGRIVEAVEKPVVVDGDGLTALGRDASCVARRAARSSGPLVLTPHAGELARLIGWEVERIEGDRVAAVREACRRYGSVVVLKGAHTLIGEPSGEIWVNLTGNPGMATPGSGDVLAGVIAAMIGRGSSACEGARLGAAIHGIAGDLAAEAGEDGVIARSILSRIPQAVERLRSEPQTAMKGVRLLG